jgi:hypothetical protein
VLNGGCQTAGAKRRVLNVAHSSPKCIVGHKKLKKQQQRFYWIVQIFIKFLIFLMGFLSENLSDYSQIGVGSPSLLSLHTRGKGVEQLTSLPNLISGFSSHDQQAWMDFIFESTNITEQTEQLEEVSIIKL